MTTVDLLPALVDQAWDRYEDASARASRFLRGEQRDLVDTAHLEAAEWLAIYRAVERHAVLTASGLPA